MNTVLAVLAPVAFALVTSGLVFWKGIALIDRLVAWLDLFPLSPNSGGWR